MVFISKVNNYMFRPKTAIFRLSQLQFCSKSVIYIYIYVCVSILHSDGDVYLWLWEAMYVQRNNGARSRNQSCCGKATIITYSDYAFAAFVIQNAKSMHRIILPSVGGSAMLYFSKLSHQW